MGCHEKEADLIYFVVLHGRLGFGQGPPLHSLSTGFSTHIFHTIAINPPHFQLHFMINVIFWKRSGFAFIPKLYYR